MKKLIGITLLCSTSVMANADILGVTLGGYIWRTEVSGGGLDAPDFLGGYKIDVDQFDTSSENNSTLYAQWEHPIPFVPNIKASINSLTHDGSGAIQIAELDPFIVNKGEIDLSHYDIIAYWPVLDNFVSLDLGINIRTLDGNIALYDIEQSSGQQIPNSDIQLQTTIALLYTRTQLNLPLGFTTGLELMGGDNGDERAIDANLYASYTSSFGLGVDAGYRILNTELESEIKNVPKSINTIFADLDFEGAYLGLHFSF